MNTEITETTAIPPWVVMWALAFGIYAGCKWWTWRDAVRKQFPSAPVSVFYLFFWPGMDANAFFNGRSPVTPPGIRESVSALVKTAIGAILIWGIAHSIPAGFPLVRGWTGMIGLILLLHFGFFHLLSVFWRRIGICAPPLMRAPLAATALSEFWGRRWNRGCHDIVSGRVYAPLQRAFGPVGAIAGTFLVSGLIHEAVISVPARGGYGGPTSYFLLQAAGVLFERSQPGLRLGLRKGWARMALVRGIHGGTGHGAVPRALCRAGHPSISRGYSRFMKTMLFLGGVLHFAILSASALVPRVLDWRRNLASLHPFLRQLFWVYGVFIVLIVVGFGTITLTQLDALLDGALLARATCGLIAVFWLARLAVQLAVFDCREFLTNRWLRIGYHCLTLAFIYLTAVYGWVALAERTVRP